MTTTPEAARAALASAHAWMLPDEIAAHALDLAAALAEADQALALTVDNLSRTRNLAESLRGVVAYIADTLNAAAEADKAGNAGAAGALIGLAMQAATTMRTDTPFPEVGRYAPLAEIWPAAFSPAVECGTLH